MKNKKKLIILIPVLDDWDSLFILLQELKKALENLLPENYSILVVNDFSSLRLDKEKFEVLKIPIQVLNLKKNLGHQRAIASGLCFINKNMNLESVIVMDSDGEDKPVDIISLYKLSKETNEIVFAKRIKRSESFVFKMFYKIYKGLFRLFVGQKIGFGNFSILPFSSLEPLVYDSNLWNNYSATIMRSRLPYLSLPTERGYRYSGKSKMNFISLITHGFGSISVYSDIVSTRLVMFSGFIAVLTCLSIILVGVIRFFTDFAVPGWATYSILAMTIILFQALFMGIFALFIFLSSRSNKSIIPANEFEMFVSSIDKINCNE